MKIQFTAKILLFLLFASSAAVAHAQRPLLLKAKCPNAAAADRAQIIATQNGDVEITTCREGRNLLINGALLTSGSTLSNIETGTDLNDERRSILGLDGITVFLSSDGSALQISGGGGFDTIVVSANEASLQAAINTADDKPRGVVSFGANIPIGGTLIIPGNVKLKPQNGAQITKTRSGKIVCQSECLDDPMSRTVVFSGFAPGDITFTGDRFPAKIAANLFGAASLSESIKIADAAFKHAQDPAQNKKVTIYLYERPRAESFTTQFTVSDNHTLELGAGDFYCEHTNLVCFRLGKNNTALRGQGASLSAIYEPDRSNAPIVWTEAAYNNQSVQGENVLIENLAFKSDVERGLAQQSSAVGTGNIKNFTIRNCLFDNLKGYSIQVGSDDTNQNIQALNGNISGNTFTRIGYEAIAIVNGSNISIENNKFSHFGATVLYRTGVSVTSGSPYITVPSGGLNKIYDGVAYWGRLLDSAGNFKQNVRILSSATRGCASLRSGFIKTDTRATSCDNAAFTATNAILEIVTEQTHVIDLEPNQDQRLSGIQIRGNTIDGTNARVNNWFGIMGHPPAKDIIIADNQFIGALTDRSATPESLRGVVGIQLDGADGGIISNNIIKGFSLYALNIRFSRALSVHDNQITMAGGSVTPTAYAAQYRSVTDSIFSNNHFYQTNGYPFPAAQTQNAVENELSVTVNVASEVISVTGGEEGFALQKWMGGKTLSINGTDYAIAYSSSNPYVWKATGAPNLTGATAMFKVSNNKYYSENGNLQLSAAGTSKINPFAGAAFLGNVTAPTAAPGTNTTQVATTAFVANAISGARPYQVYTALLTQTGTSAPTVTVLENTLSAGLPVWTRTAAGVYAATLRGAFTSGKTAVFVNAFSSNSSGGKGAAAYWTSANAVTVRTGDIAPGNNADDVLNNTFFEIRVYP